MTLRTFEDAAAEAGDVFAREFGAVAVRCMARVHLEFPLTHWFVSVGHRLYRPRVM